MRYEPGALRAQCKASFRMVKMSVGGHCEIDVQTTEFAYSLDHLGVIPSN